MDTYSESYPFPRRAEEHDEDEIPMSEPPEDRDDADEVDEEEDRKDD